MRTFELQTELGKKKMEFNADKDTYENELTIEKEEDARTLKNAVFQSRKQEVSN